MAAAGLKVHGSPMSTAVTRVLACIYEKQLDFEFITVDMKGGEHKKEPFLSLNPFGKVPAVEDGDLILFESRAITLHITHKYFENGTQLLLDERKMAVLGIWLEVEAHQFEPVASKLTWELLKKPILLGIAADESIVKEYEEKLAKVLDVYEAQLTKSKYLADDNFTLADLHHLPNLHYLMKTPAKTLLDSRPKVSSWCADILARPAWLKVIEMQDQAEVPSGP